MDDHHVDALARVLTAGSSRPNLLGLLATLPILGGLLGILDVDEATAAVASPTRRR